MNRVAIFLATAFFITMNVLLWRSEFGGRNEFGAKIPPESVWEKLLTAPDNSFLTIHHHGKKIGSCHWSPTIGQKRAKSFSEEPPPEGMIEEPTSYDLDLNGNFLIDDANRVRFDVELRLDTNQLWQKFDLKISLRPSVWELHATAADQLLRLHIDDGQERSDRKFTFAELRQPDKLLREFGGPALPMFLGPLGLSSRPQNGPQPNLLSALHWQARYDKLRIAGDWMRVFRLQARLLDRFEAVMFVSPVGEILKVELPDELVLINEALANLGPLEDDRTDPRR